MREVGDAPASSAPNETTGALQWEQKGSVTMIGTSNILTAPGTIIGNCGALPAGVITTLHIGAIQVGTMQQ